MASPATPAPAADTAGATLLECEGVSKYFGALAAVKDLSFSVKAGEVLGIGGPNGAGKTTLFEVISGQTTPTEGAIHFDGRDIAHMSAQGICHAGIARTFQLNAAFEHLTVWDNVAVSAHFGRHNRIFPGLRLDRRARELSREMIDLVGLTDSVDVEAEHLPVIDRKRLMIASALVTEPRLLLMDEPVGGLTPPEIDEIQKLVMRLHEGGLTIVVIEHVMRFLMEVSSRVMILDHGEKIFEDEPAQLLRDPTVIEVYLGKSAAQSLLATHGGGEDAGAES